jgi:RHS repeat-associated protein
VNAAIARLQPAPVLCALACGYDLASEPGPWANAGLRPKTASRKICPSPPLAPGGKRPQPIDPPQEFAFSYVETASAPIPEFWDQDAQLLYLRARWYDPSVGRFISADPWTGRVREPRTLHRYGYAAADPVNGADPSGAMTVGETMTAMNNIYNIASTVIDVAHSMLGISETVSENASPGLFDLLTTNFLGGPSGIANLLEDHVTKWPSADTSWGKALGNPAEHHMIPIYLCGRRSIEQTIPLPQAVHVALHDRMENLVTMIDWAGRLAMMSLAPGRRGGGLARSIRVQYLTKKANRGAVSVALGLFYERNDWFGNPTGAHGRYKTVPFDVAFRREAADYRTKTAYTSLAKHCSRKPL